MATLKLDQVQIVILIVIIIVGYLLYTRCDFRCTKGAKGIEGLIRTQLPRGPVPGTIKCGEIDVAPGNCQFTYGIGNIKPPMYVYAMDQNNEMEI